LINGKIDNECLLISDNLVKKLIKFSWSLLFWYYIVIAR
jgi:hypothetical protein